MTTSIERTRCVLQVGEFLKEIHRNRELPEKVRMDAKFLLRHYPSKSDLILAGRIEEQAIALDLVVAMEEVFSSYIGED